MEANLINRGPKAVREWIASAKPGERAVYAMGIDLFQTGDGRKRPASVEAWKAYEDGLVHLVQRRVDPQNGMALYQYLMVRGRGRVRKVEALFEAIA